MRPPGRVLVAAALAAARGEGQHGQHDRQKEESDTHAGQYSRAAQSDFSVEAYVTYLPPGVTLTVMGW